MNVALIKPSNLLNESRGIGSYTQNLFLALSQIGELKIRLVEFSRNPLACRHFDLIHFSYFDPFFLTLPPVRIRKTVVMVHDMIPLRFPENYPPGVRGEINWQIQKSLLKTTQAIITNSQSSKRDIVQFTDYPAQKIFPIALAADKIFAPINNQKLLATVSQKYQLPQKFVLYVGGANWNKNIPTLIQSCQKLNVSLVLVGGEFINQNYDPNHAESLSLNEVHQLAHNSALIKMVGFVKGTDLAAIYNLAAAYVQPSVFEGFGIPILEAMGCATPVVCGRGGAIPEVAGNAAVYTRVDSVDALAKTLKKVLAFTPSQKKAWSQKDLLQVKKFSWEKTARETVQVYKTILT